MRLNPQEERVIKKLVEYYDEDRSKLLKRSLFELYENIIDGKEIEKFEKRNPLIRLISIPQKKY